MWENIFTGKLGKMQLLVISAAEGPNDLFHGTSVVAVRGRSSALNLFNPYATTTFLYNPESEVFKAILQGQNPALNP